MNDGERPRVADGEDGLQTWWVSVDILNKQSQTAENMLSSSLGAGREANNASQQKKKKKQLHGASDFAGSSYHGNEISGSIKGREFLD